ncbi:hypothetical protein GN956_G5549 [Arapaima gigas]
MLRSALLQSLEKKWALSHWRSTQDCPPPDGNSTFKSSEAPHKWPTALSTSHPCSVSLGKAPYAQISPHGPDRTVRARSAVSLLGAGGGCSQSACYRLIRAGFWRQPFQRRLERRQQAHNWRRCHGWTGASVSERCSRLRGQDSVQAETLSRRAGAFALFRRHHRRRRAFISSRISSAFLRFHPVPLPLRDVTRALSSSVTRLFTGGAWKMGDARVGRQ